MIEGRHTLLCVWGSVLLCFVFLSCLETDTEDCPLFSPYLMCIILYDSCNNEDLECSCANAPDQTVCTSNGQSVTLDGRGGGIISRCSTTDFQTAEPSSCVVLAYIWQPNGNHNGGKRF